MSNDGIGLPEGQARFTYSKIPLAMRKDPKLKDSDILVTMFVLPWLNRDGYGWVTVDTISCGVGMCERAVQYSLKRLARARWFTIERSGRSRRTFTAKWLTREGFEYLADRMEITSRTPQVPDLVYIETTAKTNGGAPDIEEPKRSIQSFSSSTDSLMQASNQANQPQGSFAADDEDPEWARNLASVRRSVPALYRSRLPRRALNGPVGCLARIVAQRLFDDHSESYHCDVLWRIVDGEIEPGIYLEALAITLAQPGEQTDNYGAYFKRTLDNLRHRRTEDEFAEEWAIQTGELVTT